jgi:hypothetical protein
MSIEKQYKYKWYFENMLSFREVTSGRGKVKEGTEEREYG